MDKESNLADHGVRKYENEVGVFTSIDPLWEQYRNWSPYQYAGNNPIMALDWNGKEFNYSSYNNPQNARIMEESVNMSIEYLINNGADEEAKILTTLRDDPDVIVFFEFNNYHDTKAIDKGSNVLFGKKFYKESAVIRWDPFSALTTSDGLNQSPALGLLHDADHIFDLFYNPCHYDNYMYNFKPIFPNMDSYEEERIIIFGSERRAAIKLFEGLRNDHKSGFQYRVNSPIKR